MSDVKLSLVLKGLIIVPVIGRRKKIPNNNNIPRVIPDVILHYRINPFTARFVITASLVTPTPIPPCTPTITIVLHSIVTPKQQNLPLTKYCYQVITHVPFASQ